MANTTFSGPILAGTIKNTTGTTVGTDMKNTGQVMMSQTFSFDYTVENTATSTMLSFLLTLKSYLSTLT